LCWPIMKWHHTGYCHPLASTTNHHTGASTGQRVGIMQAFSVCVLVCCRSSAFSPNGWQVLALTSTISTVGFTAAATCAMAMLSLQPPWVQLLPLQSACTACPAHAAVMDCCSATTGPSLGAGVVCELATGTRGCSSPLSASHWGFRQQVGRKDLLRSCRHCCLHRHFFCCCCWFSLSGAGQG
jgi:hypothetical protein